MLRRLLQGVYIQNSDCFLYVFNFVICSDDTQNANQKIFHFLTVQNQNLAMVIRRNFTRTFNSSVLNVEELKKNHD